MGLGFRERDLVQKRVGLGLDSGILESIRESPRATGGPLKSTKSVGFELAVPLPERDGRIGLVWFWGLCTAAV